MSSRSISAGRSRFKTLAIANRLLARIARTGGGKLLDKATERLFATGKPAADAPKPKRPITAAIIGGAIARIATRSVPGAIVVGGGILAKTLYGRRRAHRSRTDEARDAGS